ncbi:MAG: rhodanese-like domain-containing protein [Phaeodactylibacter sp.]|nr:rhodanese-like domain-containing protein [Phaeodactylibacter sp.]MCB9275666.1 rhodanese-like domain-containing protein [Lewinellaceae bacterium]
MLIQDIPNALQGTIVDVRSAEEFELAHANNSVNIPWDIHQYYLRELEGFPLPWIFVCEEGYRSGWVVMSLKMLGYEEVYNAGRWFDIDKEKENMIPAAA